MVASRGVSFLIELRSPVSATTGYLGMNQIDGRSTTFINNALANTDLLGWAIERATGRSFASLVGALLWKPVGASGETFITVDPKGAPRCTGGIRQPDGFDRLVGFQVVAAHHIGDARAVRCDCGLTVDGQCGQVLVGAIKPHQCKVFGTACTPERPLGTCMVSAEGACAAYYAYGRHAA